MYYSVKRFSVVGFEPMQRSFSVTGTLTEKIFNRRTKQKYRAGRTKLKTSETVNKISDLDGRIDRVVNSMKKHGMTDTGQLTGEYKNWVNTSQDFNDAVMSRLTGKGNADSNLLAKKSKGLIMSSELLADRVSALSKTAPSVATEGGLDIKNNGGWKNLNVRLNNDGSASTEGVRTALEGNATSSIRTKGDKRRARQAWNANNNQMRVNVIQSKGGRKKVKKANLVTQLGEAPAPNKPNGLGVEDIYTRVETPNRKSAVVVKPNDPVQVVREVAKENVKKSRPDLVPAVVRSESSNVPAVVSDRVTRAVEPVRSVSRSVVPVHSVPTPSAPYTPSSNTISEVTDSKAVKKGMANWKKGLIAAGAAGALYGGKKLYDKYRDKDE